MGTYEEGRNQVIHYEELKVKWICLVPLLLIGEPLAEPYPQPQMCYCWILECG